MSSGWFHCIQVTRREYVGANSATITRHHIGLAACLYLETLQANQWHDAVTVRALYTSVFSVIVHRRHRPVSLLCCMVSRAAVCDYRLLSLPVLRSIGSSFPSILRPHQHSLSHRQ